MAQLGRGRAACEQASGRAGERRFCARRCATPPAEAREAPQQVARCADLLDLLSFARSFARLPVVMNQFARSDSFVPAEKRDRTSKRASAPRAQIVKSDHLIGGRLFRVSTSLPAGRQTGSQTRVCFFRNALPGLLSWRGVARRPEKGPRRRLQPQRARRPPQAQLSRPKWLSPGRALD